MPTVGLNLRVTTDTNQGGRKYMEDVLSVQFEKGLDGQEIEFAYFAVFDGHGGPEAAKFAKEHLLTEIKKNKGFWSDDDVQVMKAIRDGFISAHKLMWKDVGSWPRTGSGLQSTAGTTASVVIIRDSNMYVAHVGDSTVVLGWDKHGCGDVRSHVVTRDHKPESPEEKSRIELCGGSVVAKAGVQRVVWYRPKPHHKGPIRRSTQIDVIPFLAVARSLGDLWSYNSQQDTFVVSPVPDVCVYRKLDWRRHRFLILASDGLWNVVRAPHAVDYVMELEEKRQNTQNDDVVHKKPATGLVQMALNRWNMYNYRADNTSVIVVLFDPPGSPGARRSPSPLGQSSDGSENEASDEEVCTTLPEPLRLEMEASRVSGSGLASASSSPLMECKGPDNQLNCKLWKPSLRRPIHKGTRPFTPRSAPPKLGAARRGICKVRPKFRKLARLHDPLLRRTVSASRTPSDSTESPVAESSPACESDTGPPDVFQSPVLSGVRSVTAADRLGVSMTPGAMGVDIGCPQKAATPCSPLKVNVAANAAANPCLGLVSPIWPNSLELDIDVAAEVSLESTCPHEHAAAPSDDENTDQQCTSCRTPTKMGLKRKAPFSPTQSPIKHIRLSSGSPHKTRSMNLRARSKTRKE